MENPATWTRLEHVIYAALEEAHRQMQEGLCGLSDVRLIADALRNEGLVVEDK